MAELTMNARLWTMLVLPESLWAAHLLIAYSLKESACASQSRLLLLVVSAAALAPMIVNAFFAWTTWHSWPRPEAGGAAGLPEDEEPRWRSRARFMAATAFCASLLFGLVIAGQTLPMVMLRPCD
ncbi:MAG TPA: hypothetical protein VF824_18670 [Thermoanaerobaculia bacterium]|jgi:hypothetical protein